MVGTGCKTAPPKGTPGYDYTVQQGDSLEVLAKAYRDQGVQVTADEIMAANPGIKVTTNLQAGVQCVAPEPGARLLIPDKNRAYLDNMKAKARHGDAEMQYALAVHYESGKDMPQDYVEAAKWYERAARQGQGKSEFWLARLYDNGLGVKKSPAQGIKWLTKSANHGYAEAQYFLGKRYQDGEGVPQNFTNAATTPPMRRIFRSRKNIGCVNFRPRRKKCARPSWSRSRHPWRGCFAPMMSTSFSAKRPT